MRLPFQQTHALFDELAKIAGADSGKLKKFLEAATHEVGPAAGATIGAGLAAAYDKNPLAGSALGFGVGALPDLLLSKKQH